LTPNSKWYNIGYDPLSLPTIQLRIYYANYLRGYNAISMLGDFF